MPKRSINNSNVTSVGGGIGAASRGNISNEVELAIPLAALGLSTVPCGGIKVCMFINSVGHDHVSNQVLGPLPVGTDNRGEPRLVNFDAITGGQLVTVPAVACKADYNCSGTETVQNLFDYLAAWFARCP